MKKSSADKKEESRKAAVAQEFIETLPMNYVVCREMSHQWKANTAVRFPAERSIQRTLQCLRCSALRVQWMTFSGHVFSSYYRHPKGYLLTGAGRLGLAARDTLRIMSMESSGLRDAEEFEVEEAKQKATV